MLHTKMLKLIMLLIAAVCLLSFPVLSGENPWDADDGPGSGNDGGPIPNPDSSKIIINPADDGGISRVTDQGSWYDDLIINTSLYLYNWMYRDFDIKDNKRFKQERGSRISHKLR